jgi:hypothetical protein
VFYVLLPCVGRGLCDWSLVKMSPTKCLIHDDTSGVRWPRSLQGLQSHWWWWWWVLWFTGSVITPRVKH